MPRLNLRIGVESRDMASCAQKGLDCGAWATGTVIYKDDRMLGDTERDGLLQAKELGCSVCHLFQSIDDGSLRVRDFDPCDLTRPDVIADWFKQDLAKIVENKVIHVPA